MLIKHSQTAQSMGIPAENMVIINNGDIVELTEESIQIDGQVPSGIELMDRAGTLKAHVLEERQRLAEDGAVTVAATVSLEGQLLTDPEVHLRGVVTTIELEKWQKWIQSAIELALRNRWDQYCNSDRSVDWDGLKSYIERELKGLLRRELQTNATLLLLFQHPQDRWDSKSKSKREYSAPRSKTTVAS